MTLTSYAVCIRFTVLGLSTLAASCGSPNPVDGVWQSTEVTSDQQALGYLTMAITLALKSDATFTDDIHAGISLAARARAGCMVSVHAQGGWRTDTLTLYLVPDGGDFTMSQTSCSNASDNDGPVLRSWNNASNYEYQLAENMLSLANAEGVTNDFLDRTLTRSSP